MAALLWVLVTGVAITVRLGFADPDLLQDVCVADIKQGLKVNGFTCKPSTNISSDDFSFSGLAKAAATNNIFGSTVTAANVEKVPGLNTLGESLARIDYAPNGLNPPHVHPRATEVVYVLEGELHVGFITTSNILVSRIIKKGDVFVFPRGLLHFQINEGERPAAAIAAFNSQLPGTQSIPLALFTAAPPLPENVLSKALQLSSHEIKTITSRLSPRAS